MTGKLAPLLLEHPILPRNDPWAALEEQIRASVDEDGAYDILSDGLRTGRFGGVPSETSASIALVETLRMLGWPVNYRAFAGAIPHYPEQFGLENARNTLCLLGFNSEQDKVRGRNLGALPPGSFIVSTSGQILFLRLNADGMPALYDYQKEQFKRLSKRKIYDVIVVTSAPLNSAPTKASWIGRIMYRFGAENRTILALTFLSNTLIILASLSVGFIFDKVLPAKAYDTLAGLVAGIIMLLYIDLRLRKVKSQIIAQVSGRLEYIVSSALYEKLITFRLEMLQSASVSEQINRLKQFETVRDFFCGPIVAVLFEMPFVVLVLAFIGFLSLPIAGFLLGVVVIYLAIGSVLYPRISRNSKEMAGLRAECTRLQEEMISQREQIVQRGLGSVWIARLSPQLTRLSLARQRLETVWRMLNSLIAVVSPLAVGGVIIIGAMQVINGAMTGGTLIACMILSSRLLNPVQQALVLAVRAPEITGLFRQMDAMMQIPSGQPNRTANTTHFLHKHSSAPPISIDGLVLRYPKSVTPALKGLNLRIAGGSLTCVTGPSGAGKSSLLASIMGHYRAQNGTVLIGPSNIEQLDSREKTDLIGYIGHKSLQIHGTIAQNMRLTRPEATMDHLEQICAELGILETIMAQPEGFDTRLEQHRRFLFAPSFRTKFSIAQLLLKNPRVLLLDEPESGLSDQDEHLLMSAIKARAGRMTCLMVTHRPSLVRQADRALVLQDGQVKFFGPPAELDARSA